MRVFQILLLGLLLPGSGIRLSAATPNPGNHSAVVAAYDAILANVAPGQTTLQLGDMVVPLSTVQMWRNRLAGTAVNPSSSSSSDVNLWTGGNVYYTFNANVTAAHQKDFLDAAGEWMAFANVHFIARTSQANYVVVNDGGSDLDGGNSYVGMFGGPQPLNIGANSWNRNTLLHEIGHALGLIHEHQRNDRDNYVTINFSNVPGGTTDGNFILIPTSTNNGAYDFLSVMHYSRNALAVNPAIDTITPKAAYGQYLNIMGQNPDRILSRADRDGMAILYGAGPTATTTVTNTKDSGAGAFRTAIYHAFDLATDTPGATPTISFHIPISDPQFSGGFFTISPSDRLPAPGPGTTIDGTTQTAFTGNTNPDGPEIVLNGALQVSPDTYGLGLRLSAPNVTVLGLVINGFSTQGILITGAAATANTVAGCYIGTNAAGTAAVANSFAGIEIDGGASGNIIGGTTDTTRNVISGNSAQGIYLRDAGTSGNVIEGNYLGVKANGSTALPNGFSGVEVGLGASGNTIGGNVAGAGNVLSGNVYQGVYINGTSSNVIAGNLVGTNAAGTAALANGTTGIEISGGGQNNIVGGTTTAGRNVISGNSYQGVILYGAGTSGNVVRGNYVGLNATGTAAVANFYSGVGIFGGATNNTIGGATSGAANVLSGNSAQGVAISDSGSTGNVVAGNLIGTNPAGTSAIPNAYSGVGIFGGAANNLIGGTSPGAGNLISGNSSQGIYIGDSGTMGNVTEGNWIGIDITGNTAVPNAFAGVEISNGAQNNIVGGTTTATRNIISGNESQGVALDGAGTSNNQISGNYIGTNPSGTRAIANGYPGVEIFSDASANVVGGTAPGAGNVISGNSYRGMTIAGANGNIVTGNLVGLNAAGTASLPNAGPGIQIFGGAQGNTIGSTNGGRNFISGNNGAGLTLSGAGTNTNTLVGNTIGLSPSGAVVPNSNEGVAFFQDSSGSPQGNLIGGAPPGSANIISGNSGPGVALYNAGTVNNRISGNSIYANGGLGIDLWGDGVTANDSGDGDTGPNNLQNSPFLGSAVLGVGTTINGTLNSIANSTFRVEFFANTAGDPSGNGEGQNFIGATSVTTNSSGNGSFSTLLPATIPAGRIISATATDAAGNTSEFAHNVTVATTDSDGDGIPDAWMTAVFGHTTGLAADKSRATDDADGDGFTNLQEFRAGTNSRNSSSLFELMTPAVSGADRLIPLSSVNGFLYRIEYSDGLFSPSWHVLADQILGNGATMTITDPGAGALPQRFYRAVVLP